MTSQPATTERFAQAGALLVAGALGVAVFYQGPQIPLLATAQFLLVAWIALSLAGQYTHGVRLPLTPLTVCLTLFWVWLGVSLSWSAVPVISVVNFWWIGSVVLAFWAYTLAPQRERVWFYASRAALAGALTLCAYALWQRFVQHQPPRSTFVNIHSFAALMMLAALPLGGYFLIAWHHRAPRRTLLVVGACLFVLYFTIATTEGRGTTLSIALSLAVFAAAAARTLGRKPVLALLGIVLGAYAVANALLHGGLEDRIATLTDPASAALPRLLIWRGSWEMLTHEPWWGIGLGTYYLAWPPFRDPADTSLGFFAHNDYLQIWIEAGLPALALLLSVFISVLVLFTRLIRSRVSAALQIEALGLFAGLLAVAAHSFLDFNLYILSISITAGLVLGRFHQCVCTAIAPREYVLQSRRLMQAHAYRLTVALLALFPLLYFVALGVSDHLYKRGFALAADGKLVGADKAFTWAERLLPGDDKVLTMHADLYRHVVKRLPPSAAAERRSLYEAALAMLEEAQSDNRYRSLVHVVRGRIWQENPDFAGPRWREDVEAEYAKAIELDPRFFATRMDYAKLLLDAGRKADAYRILNAGMDYWYYPNEAVLAYYGFTGSVARDLGLVTRADEIEREMQALRRAIANVAPARPVAPDLTPPTPSSS